MMLVVGLVMGGLYFVVVIYLMFLNWVFDQIMMDVVLYKLLVIMVLDCVGIIGSDGVSYNGMWDLLMLGIVFGIWVVVFRDVIWLCEEFGEVFDVDDGLMVLWFFKGDVGEDILVLEWCGGVDVLVVFVDGLNYDVLLVVIGVFVLMVLVVVKWLYNQGIGVMVIDLCWVLLVFDGVCELVVQYKLFVMLEDNGVNGGVGLVVLVVLWCVEIDVFCCDVGLLQEFYEYVF